MSFGRGYKVEVGITTEPERGIRGDFFPLDSPLSKRAVEYPPMRPFIEELRLLEEIFRERLLVEPDEWWRGEGPLGGRGGVASRLG